jgi:serine/threonine protein phosphatase 1
MAMRSYAIGDIHGQFDLLRRAHDLIADDQAHEGGPASPIIHLGDLVDRGPDSAKVVAYLGKGTQAGENWITLKGNHDRMLSLFMAETPQPDPVLRPDLSYLHPRIGGGATLASYGVANAADRPLAPVHAEALAAFPDADRAFLADLPVMHQRGEVVFVHAGLRPGVALKDQTEDDLVWIRDPFLPYRDSFGPLVIHGHTALNGPVHYGNRVNIDSGAAYGGPLTAIVIEGRDVFVLTQAGRIPLPITPDAAVR